LNDGAAVHISELICRHVRIPLKTKVKHASHERESTDSLVVSCRLSEGTIGWGEGLPREYVTGDTVEDDLRLFEETDWAALFSGEISTLEEAVQRVDRIQFHDRDPTGRGAFGNPLRCAIELAILDAVTRSLGVSMSSLFDCLPEATSLRKQSPSIQYSGVITSTTLTRVKWYARAYRWTGFQHCKVKVGVAGVDDVELLTTARKHLGSNIALRVDANEAWNRDNLLEKIAQLKLFDLVALEQPVPHEDIQVIADLKPNITIPVMLDESLCSLADGRRAIEQKYCDSFNIRISKCGGLMHSVRLARMAKQAGLSFQLGCQVGETGILSAAGRHFLTNIGGWIAAEGSFDRFLVQERLTKEDLTFGWGGKAPALTKPGLGISVDNEAIERVTIARKDAVIG
jgi:muconate cycloisomerase